jgi:HEAT repeat protein
MPFVKSSISTPPKAAQPEAPMGSSITDLNSPDIETRWNAARLLGAHADSVPALATALAAEQAPRVREAIITALVRIGDAASAKALLPYIRSQDAGQRTATIDALQSLPDAILPFMESLLKDTDSDVRILATELARNMPAADATLILCKLLAHEQHANVCAAAIEVLAEVGTRDAVPVLQACAERFSGTPFLPFAVSTAIARISSEEN